MHRQCEGCPFVLQLLAAKRCRGGSLLLLTEVGSGSLTDVLARLQVTGKEQEHPPVLLRVDTADDAAAVGSVLHPAGVAPAAAAVLLHGVDAAEDAAAGDDRTAAAAAAAPEERPGLCEDAARFYTGCILMGLQWLHSRRIVHRCVCAPACQQHHKQGTSSRCSPSAPDTPTPLTCCRDVKPCNLLLFGDGYMKLADLGGCVLLPPGIDAAHTRTGTASHMAPEVLSSGSGSGGSGYSFPVDL
jgi:serine/threonine protein kinase